MIWEAILKQFIQKYILKIVAGFGGIKGWIIRKVLEYGGALLIKGVKWLVTFFKRKVVNKENVQEYKEAIANPETPKDEVLKSGQNLLNGTRD